MGALRALVERERALLSTLSSTLLSQLSMDAVAWLAEWFDPLGRRWAWLDITGAQWRWLDLVEPALQSVLY